MLFLFVFIHIKDFPYEKIGPFTEPIELSPGNYTIELYGAQGGRGSINGQNKGYGGKGTYIFAKFSFTGAKKTFYVNVGGQGSSDPYHQNDGGFNGGGRSGKDYGSLYESTGDTSGGGGGATDLRLNDNSTESRVIVAAGGSGGVGSADGAPGGDKYGRYYKKTGYTYTIEESGLTTQSFGNSSGFGEEGASYAKIPGSGGGGGWRGGASTKEASDSDEDSYAAVSHSGSSFVSGCFLCLNKKQKFYDAEWTIGYNEGNGKIKITYDLEIPENCSVWTDSDTCKTCLEGNILYMNKCYSQCPEKTRESKDSCEECPENCLNCDSSKNKCDICDNQSFKYNDICYLECSDLNSANGYFGKNDEKRTCEKCDDINCIDCSSDFLKCKRCADPYVIDTKSSKCVLSTSMFSNSNMFSPSGLFSQSSDFTFTDDFSKSSDFTFTSHFSKSSDFTFTDHFSKSSDFTFTDHFSKSSDFTLTDHFSKSFDFSSTTDFTLSSNFSKSDFFNVSTAFTNSFDFTSSRMFSHSSHFSTSSDFTPSSKFSKTFDFSRSSDFSNSKSFKHSEVFTKSLDFTTSSKFSASFKFSNSNVFSSDSDQLS